MCGVFASTAPEAWRGRHDEIFGLLDHRGPDGHGKLLLTGGPLLAHTRLAIIGLGDAGIQPATSTDGTTAVVYNGEIYNFRALATGTPRPDASSDTQVLADLLAEDPGAALGTFRGMWAFAAWHAGRGELLAARDPFGIKPLYALGHADGGVTLSSELPPLLLSSEVTGLDEQGLSQYLAFGHTGPTRTVYRNITKLLPGRLYRWRRASAAGPWTMRVEQATAAPDPVLDVGTALGDSVSAHLVADVEVGCFLSGGVDSTLLAALASERTHQLRTFTLSFPDSPASDESALAEHNARLLGSKHVTIPVRLAEMGACARTVLRVHGEPLGDAAVLPLTHLAERAAQDVKVVLAGEGADELFGGYSRYKISRRLPSALAHLAPATAVVADRWAKRRSGAPWARAVEATLRGGGFRGHAALLDADLALLHEVHPRVAGDLMARLVLDWSALAHERDNLQRAQLYDRTRWLPDVYLEKTDRASMAASLEARVPYLDRSVAASAETGRSPDETKQPLRRLLVDLLPDVVTPGRKKGLLVDAAGLVAGPLALAYQYEIASARSLLGRWLGRDGQQVVAARAARSPQLGYRVAMLGLWEDECDGGRFACTT